MEIELARLEALPDADTSAGDAYVQRVMARIRRFDDFSPAALSRIVEMRFPRFRRGGRGNEIEDIF